MKYLFTCKDISKVASEDSKLSFLEKMKFKFHLFICHDCKNFVLSMKELTSLTKKIIKKNMTIDENELTQIENRIIKKISKK